MWFNPSLTLSGAAYIGRYYLWQSNESLSWRKPLIPSLLPREKDSIRELIATSLPDVLSLPAHRRKDTVIATGVIKENKFFGGTRL